MIPTRVPGQSPPPPTHPETARVPDHSRVRPHRPGLPAGFLRVGGRPPDRAAAVHVRADLLYDPRPFPLGADGRRGADDHGRGAVNVPADRADRAPHAVQAGPGLGHLPAVQRRVAEGLFRIRGGDVLGALTVLTGIMQFAAIIIFVFHLRSLRPTRRTARES